MGFRLERVIVDIALLVAIAKLLEGLLGRVGVPSFASYVAAGLALGFLGVVSYSESLSVVAAIAIFFIALYAGLETPFGEFFRLGFKSLPIALVSFTSTFLVAAVTSSLLGLDFVDSVIVGLVLSVTALPVAAAILGDLGLLGTRVGALVIGGAVVKDVLVILILGLLAGFLTSGSPSIGSLLKAIMGVTVLALTATLAHATLSRVSEGSLASSLVSRLVKSPEAGLAVVLTAALGLGALSEALGLHFVIGVFLAGLLVDESWMGREAHRRALEAVKGVTVSLLLPLFASIIGLIASTAPLSSLLTVETIWLTLVFTTIALLAKYSSSYLGARIVGITPAESMLVGIASTLKGAMDKIVLLVAYQLGILAPYLLMPLMSSLVIVTVAAPIALRAALRSIPESVLVEVVATGRKNVDL